MGCKNFLCCGTQGINPTKAAKIASSLDPENNEDRALEKEFLKIPYQDRDGNVHHLFAANSCYHVLMHKAEFDGLHY